MQNNKAVLTCKKVKFFSQIDEDMFFAWIEKANYVKEFKGVRDTIELIIVTPLKRDDLFDLFALFRRYKINSKQLVQFCGNQELLDHLKKCFHVNVYPHRD